MVIPWMGFPLADCSEGRADLEGQVRRVQTLSTRADARRGRRLQWPYVEGLAPRRGDASADACGRPLRQSLAAQNGAPLRLVVPWKYGFKSIKSIVRITLRSRSSRDHLETGAPTEYGFYANVNPTVDHPRWSQATERRIGEFGRRKTLMFNGYADQVASLYAGMDLKKNY